MKIDTDKQKIINLLERRVENIYPNLKFLEDRLNSGEQLTLYLGIDPTGPTLHLGHMIQVLKLAEFQELGHKVILLIGSFTAMIGDPTDKAAVRQPLTREQVVENCKKYQEQASVILKFEGDNPAELKFNNEWLDKMSFQDVVELASHFTVQQMMERDMFEKRIKEGKPVGLHEFLYPLMQGYDTVAMDVDGEIGGNDQTFNMLTGRTLMKAMKNKEKFVLTNKLLVDSTGKKMGKTEGNMARLDDTAEDKYGSVMSWTDGMILNGFELCTQEPWNEEVENKLKERMEKENPRDLKMELAFAITKIYHGEEGAQKAQEHFVNTIQKKDIPEEIEEFDLAGKTIIEALVESQLVSSNSEARRLITQKGVKINDVAVDDLEMKVSSGDIIKKGKRFFVKIK